MIQLPAELQAQCVEYLDIPTLKSFRLVSRAALALSTKPLFSTVELQPDDESAERYAHVLESIELNPLVRRVVFHTDEEPDMESSYAWKEEKLPLPSFLTCLRSVARFRNLREVELEFAMVCDSEQGFEKEVAETIEFRTNILEAFFEGLNHPEMPAINVESLSIRHLQDWTSYDIYESPNFKAVRSRVRSLNLRVATDVDEAAPENDIHFDAQVDFFGKDLLEHWLQPLQSQLSHLTLSTAHCYWGIVPFCDLRDIHFPLLKSLTLDGFTIAHGWQLEWILSHAASLEELVLVECPIVVALKMLPEHKQPNWPDLEPYGDTDWFFKIVDLRWHEVLSRFRSGLPHLRHFGLGEEEFKEEHGGVTDWTLKFLQDRYYMFDCGVGPSQWWIHGNRRRPEYNFGLYGEHGDVVKIPDCKTEDADALRALLEDVSQRRMSLS